ncbi:MAG: hypothetical protein PHN55_04965 [Dysgonamonadaceae bacterium]|nr:hypothetical protein [Dysgonamonadaceae bacterium]
MKINILILFVVSLLIQNIAATAQDSIVQWKLVQDDAAWVSRDSQGEVVYDGYMWIFGGWHSSFEAPPRDVWRSQNGSEWELVADDAPWLHSDLPMSLTFNDKMWMMGGWYNGRLEDRSASNSVWSSKDGCNWTLEAKQAQWSPRCAAATVTFKDKMWILGGTTKYYYGDKNSLLNDVWYSEDGENWILATENAEWPPRAFHQAVVLDDRIFILGGGNYDPDYLGYNDVWSSADGIHWVQETDNANWHERIWFSSVVYRGHIWVIGGWSNHPYKNWSDVWYSKDGKNWKELQAKGTMWKERHEHSAFVFQDKIWIAGGMTPPLVNDVWSLKLPVDWEGFFDNK